LDKILELRVKQQEAVGAARAKLDEIKDDTAEARVAELNAEHNRAMADFDKYEERIGKLQAIVDREAALEEARDDRRPVGEDRKVKPGAKDERTDEQRYAEAFDLYVRGGVADMSREQRAILQATETRAQSVSTNTLGGYLAPATFQAELIKSMKVWGPMLDGGIVRMFNTSTGSPVTWPSMDDTGNVGALIAENQQVTLAEVTFGTKSLDAYKYTSGVNLVSDELLQDAVMDVESLLRDAMAERIARIGNTHMTTGDGANKPRGIVTAAGAGATAAAASAIVFDDLINLEHSVDPAYRSDPSVRFMFNDTTLKALRKLKDGEGRYMWQPADVKAGQPSTILNYSYSINQAVADIGTGNRSVVFGAFNRYVVRMVKEFAIKRLIERYADYGQVGFIGFTRMDGDLMDVGAVKALTH